jgi:DNA topoisomerase-1
MAKFLVIVESPAKIKTLKKLLGSDFHFESSIGHIRDLPQKEFGIDIENNFEPKYAILPDKEDVVKNLQDAAKKCETVYLAPDPDREGEAIAWHIMQILPEGTKFERVAFNSITKDAVQEAINSPRSLDYALVNAQQARRLLDRIVGYKISPLLNRRMQRGRTGAVSAGRVQSVALKLVVEREKAIEIFNPVEYWNITTLLSPKELHHPFEAYVHSVGGKRVEKEEIEGKEVTLINNEESAQAIVAKLKATNYEISKVDKREKKRNPVPPFITSTLQQEASRHFGFSSANTMRIAQSLYEGVDLGKDGQEGLITYMRTDSTRIAPEAVEAVRGFIKTQYGDQYLPEKAKQYTTKKSAQDAHEGIRPTNLEHPPEMVKSFLNREEYLLYDLIWKRFVASQMLPAIYDTVSADIQTDSDILMRATGSILKFQGFLAVYEEKSDDEEKAPEAKVLPNLELGQRLKLEDLTSTQAFTKPPARFSEASLVKELEKSGIGRPSTYATIMNKIQSREYTVKENKRLRPTELGCVIAQMLETHFELIMDPSFTAKMEDNLEMVAEDKKDWNELIRDFWGEFHPILEKAEEEATVPKIPTDLDCPKCKAKLQKVWFRDAYFYGCSNYPDCDFSSSIDKFNFNKADYAEDFNWEQACPKCESEMLIRHGRYGAFLGCTKYPECRGIVNIPKLGEEIIDPSTLPSCPAIDCDGAITAKKSRFGKIFYSCSNFPDCNVIVNDLDQLTTKYVDHPKTAYVKKTRAKAGKKGKETKAKAKEKKKKPSKPRVMPKSKLSSEMAEFTGEAEMSRGNVVKKLWEHIKAQNLQDPKDKRMILPDAILAALFGSEETISMFKMNGAISKHFIK